MTSDLRLAAALATLLPIAPRPAFSFNFLAPFTKEDPRVKTANQDYSAGKYDEALRGYEDSLRDHPNAPELQFDRGKLDYVVLTAAVANNEAVVLTTAPDAVPSGVTIRRLEPRRTLAFELLWRDEVTSPALSELISLAAADIRRPSSIRALAAVA